MKNKIIASVMAVMMVFGTAFSISAYAEDAETTFDETVTASYDAAVVKSGKCGENVKWTLDANGTLTISGKGKMDTSSYPWSEYKKNIKSLVIKEGITDVDSCAFKECSSLETVSFPDSLKTIGAEAFEKCEALTEAVFPKNLESVGNMAFSECYSLVSVYIPASLTNIGFQAFHYCSGMSTIKVAAGNPKYVSVDNVLYFKDMKEPICYASKRPGEEYTIPESVVKLGVTTFDFCKNLKKVYIGKNVEDIGYCTFYSSFELTDIVVSADNPNFKSENGIVFSKDGKTLAAYPVGKRDTSYSIPKGITTIGTGAFATARFKSVTIPNTVTTIGNTAFYAASELTSVNIPDSVTVIEDSAFAYCINLEKVKLPKKIQKIGTFAFNYCDKLSSITIENKDCEIGDNSSTFPYNTVIKGHKGSTAEAYAKKYNRKFVDLDGSAKGDVNLDGSINVADIAMIASHIKGIKPLVGDSLKAADVNGDGNVNVADIAMIASHIKGIKALS